MEVRVTTGQPTNIPYTYLVKIIKPNMVLGMNILQQIDFNLTKTKYIIKWDFDLLNLTITIPENCALEINGGSLSNGTIVGNNTTLILYLPDSNVFKNITKGGEFLSILYTGPKFVILTESEYEALGSNKDQETVYLVKEDGD